MKISALLPFASLCVGAIILSACGDEPVKANANKEQAQPAPRICEATELYQIAGCNKGDQLVFTPGSWGNEQFPIWAARNCDLNKSAIWTKAGLTCIYAGPRERVSAGQMLNQKKYKPLYDQVAAKPDGWKKMDNGEYWRLSEQGAGSDITDGMSVRTEYAECEHTVSGEELGKGNYKNGSSFKVTKDHYIFMLNPKSGAIIEYVSPKEHTFLKVFKK